MATEPTPASAPIAALGPELVPAEDIRAGRHGKVREQGAEPRTRSPHVSVASSMPARPIAGGKSSAVRDRRGAAPPAHPQRPAPPLPRDPGGALSAGLAGGSILLFNTFLAILLGLMACGAFRAPTRRSASPSDRLTPAPFVPRLERPG